MGIHDSSRTRVAPVFGRLQCLDPSGRLWLQGLLELANTRKLPRPQAGTSRLRVAKWWPREARLAAPPSLLRWLLENAEEPRSAAAWGRRPEVMANRRRVVDRDADTLAGALKSLQERRPSSRAWYVLEGPSQPDVFLDTDSAIVVIEGKRSEPDLATSTAWMPVRHQMLRHLDAAWEHRQGRRIYGLFIVEAEEGAATVEPSSAWHQAVEATISEEVLKGSLRTDRRRNDRKSRVPCWGSPRGRLCATSSRYLARYSSRKSWMTGPPPAPHAGNPGRPRSLAPYPVIWTRPGCHR